MRNGLPRTCLYSLYVALLVPPATALASVDAFVFQNGPAFIIDNGTNVAGHAAAELAGGASAGAGSYAYVGSAYADTRRGSLGSAVTTSGSGYEGANDRLVVKASSSIFEMVTVSATGPVSFRLEVQGSFASDDGGQASSFASLALAAGSPSRAFAFARGSQYFDTSNVTGATVISALRSNYTVWLEGTFFATAMIPFSVAAKLEVMGSPPVTGAANALFNHTAQLAIFMPAGVNFSSESGEFLADVLTPVPEPATWCLWLLGVVLVVGIGRRVRDPLVAEQRMRHKNLSYGSASAR